MKITNNKKQIGVIYETMDLDSLTFLKENRGIKKTVKYQKLKESLKQKGQKLPALVNSNAEIIDGGHRWMVCKEENLPFRFCIFDDQNLLKNDDIMDINVFQQDWKMSDYIHRYSEKGFSSYRILEKEIEKHQEFKAAILADLFHAKNSLSRKSIEAGTYEISDTSIELGNKIIDFVKSLSEKGLLSDGSKYTSAHLLRTLKKLIFDDSKTKFSLETFEQKLKNFRPLNVFASEKDMSKEILKVYKRK